MSNDVLSNLTKVAQLFVEAVKKNVDDLKVPHEIKDVIYIDEPKILGDGKYVIEVKIPMKNGAEAAAAFEWGSGEHGKGGERYRIPEGFGTLFIDEQDWPDFEWPVKPGPRMVGYSLDGRFILRYVYHPGVEKRPYIYPAILQVMNAAVRMLGESVKTQLSVIDGKGVEVIVIK